MTSSDSESFVDGLSGLMRELKRISGRRRGTKKCRVFWDEDDDVDGKKKADGKKKRDAVDIKLKLGDDDDVVEALLGLWTSRVL